MFPGFSVARLVTSDDGDGTVRLILGASFREQKFLKPGHVYEILELDGEVTVVDRGPSWIRPSNMPAAGSPVSTGWASTPDAILGDAGKHFVLTKEEYENECRKDTPKKEK